MSSDKHDNAHQTLTSLLMLGTMIRRERRPPEKYDIKKTKTKKQRKRRSYS